MGQTRLHYLVIMTTGHNESAKMDTKNLSGVLKRNSRLFLSSNLTDKLLGRRAYFQIFRKLSPYKHQQCWCGGGW